MDPLDAVFSAERGEQEGETYSLSEAVAEVAQRHLEKHLSLARLREARVAYLLQHGKDPSPGKAREATIDTIAKAAKTNPLWQSLTGYDAVVWVNERAWDVLSAKQREAVVLHELLHLDVDEKSGKVVVYKHDIEEFGLVASEYGPWHGGLERFGEQLAMWGAEAARK